jgi:hypothetical protein
MSDCVGLHWQARASRDQKRLVRKWRKKANATRVKTKMECGGGKERSGRMSKIDDGRWAGDGGPERHEQKSKSGEDERRGGVNKGRFA